MSVQQLIAHLQTGQNYHFMELINQEMFESMPHVTYNISLMVVRLLYFHERFGHRLPAEVDIYMLSIRAWRTMILLPPHIT
ncbi:hypothetical protein ACSBR2_011917 [Camellia fascicularis]